MGFAAPDLESRHAAQKRYLKPHAPFLLACSENLSKSFATFYKSVYQRGSVILWNRELWPLKLVIGTHATCQPAR